jgi:hypothetical protein
MARNVTRALGAIVIAGACAALAACATSTPGPAGASQPGQSGAQAPGTPRAPGVPVKNGTVVVKRGAVVICVMTVTNGKGACKVPASKIGVGASDLVGSYNGKGYAPSAGRLAFTVVQAATTTSLALSAGTAGYGHEQAERLSVKVTTAAGGGTPSGTALVKDNGATICAIRLSGGSGSCALPATRLPAGSQRLTASYGGDKSHAGSTSATKTLTISK